MRAMVARNAATGCRRRWKTCLLLAGSGESRTAEPACRCRHLALHPFPEARDPAVVAAICGGEEPIAQAGAGTLREGGDQRADRQRVVGERLPGEQHA